MQRPQHWDFEVIHILSSKVCFTGTWKSGTGNLMFLCRMITSAQFIRCKIEILSKKFISVLITSTLKYLLTLSCLRSQLGPTGSVVRQGAWDLSPWPGTGTMSPALEGGFFTTTPPGKSLTSTFNLP